MTLPRSLLLLLLALVVGCSAPPASAPATGAAQLAVSTRQALASPAVSRVTVTVIVQASNAPATTHELMPTDGVWGGVIGELPADMRCTFQGQAFDASGALLYEGQAENVTIAAGQLTLVTLTLQSKTASTPYRNDAPLIDSVVASPLSVAPGGQVSLTSSARDPNPSDTLTHVWTAPAGSFAAPTAPNTSWTAPATLGPVALTLTVSDPSGARSSVTLYVQVTRASGGGAVEVKFNHPPTVTAVSSSESTLRVGQETTLTASATDLDGDTLSYRWSATCAGSFTGHDTASARFTPATYPSGTCHNCEVSVAVSDGRGGQTTGTVALCVAPAAAQHQAPTLVRTYQSSLTAKPNQLLSFEVVASDPEGSALTFSWRAGVGALGTPATTADTSRVLWTAPGCLNTGSTVLVTALVTNAFGLTSLKEFSVTGLPRCAAPATWSPTSPLSFPRAESTATLLLNGQVLVVGGRTLDNTDNLALAKAAELYEPATNTWRVTGAMSFRRIGHTATLLANGKVLVAGGGSEDPGGGASPRSTAEVYDPATGTWSRTGDMGTDRSHHTATLLPDGKVLVAGNWSGNPNSELYDPATNTWSRTGALAAARRGHTAVLLPNGTVLVAAGYGYDILATAEVYDPATGSWRATGALSLARFQHAMTLLADGTVLVAGGSSNSAHLSSAEVYDPLTGVWRTTGSMAQSRSGHTVTRLSNGKVLAVGGNGTTAHIEELYAPATGNWTPTGSLSSYRSLHTATRLPDGRVLVAGGFDDSGTAKRADLYTP